MKRKWNKKLIKAFYKTEIENIKYVNNKIIKNSYLWKFIIFILISKTILDDIIMGKLTSKIKIN